MPYTKEEMIEKVQSAGTWHYCWELPHGVLTGDSAPNLFPEKMGTLLAGGAFAKETYLEVLDLGANSGYISKWFADTKKSHVTAVEQSEQYFPQLELVVEVLGYRAQIEPVCADFCARSVLYLPNTYDLILLLGVLHHLPQGKHGALFNNCYDALKPEGEFVVQTKENLFVAQKMRGAGFTDVRQVYWSDKQERGAWMANKCS